MSLRDIKIKNEYRSLVDNVAQEFYIPLLSEAKCYNRAVGFFSSTALVEISKGISSLAKNGGNIKLVASPYLSKEDIEAIKLGYELRNNIIKDAILRELKDASNVFEEERLNILANLISDGVLDIKIAFTNDERKLGMYHEKMGIINDDEGNSVAFSGSLNESATALLANYEAIDVFCSWNGDLERVIAKEKAFLSIWNNAEPNINIIEFPELKQEIIDRYKISQLNYDLVKEVSIYNTNYKNINKKPEGVFVPDNVSLHDYQIEAINNWEKSNFRGIFDMATGTGKTFTGLGALAKLFESKNGNLAVIIVCPYQHLVEQWIDDLALFNITPIVGYSSSQYINYKSQLKNAIFDFDLGVKKFFCFICTNASYATPDVQLILTKLNKNALIIVDEAHNFGAENLSKTLKKDYDYRLALSATLDRHNDEIGTEKLYNFFGKKCIEYDLERAINEKKLTEYYYFPLPIYLNDNELDYYVQLSHEIRKSLSFDKNGKVKMTEKAKRLALKRSRIVAAAIGKVEALKAIIKDFKTDRHMLIYCGAANISGENTEDGEDVRQIDHITHILGEELGMNVSQFTSRETMEERALLKKKFEEGTELQGLVAIRCLDEGVNIPMIKTAFILASTTNPKEYIQRRGRVLRLFPGKQYAKIYDFITLPRPLDTVKSHTKDEVCFDLALIRNELNRIEEFRRLSLNPYDSSKLINEISEAYDLILGTNIFDPLEEEFNHYSKGEV